MPRYDVPRLADYSAAVQANRTMADAFRNLGNQSQDYLNFEERKKNSAWEQAFKDKDYTTKENQFNKNFDYQSKRDAVKDNQWRLGYDLQKDNVAFDQNYKTNTFNHNVNQDNIKNNQWSKAFSLQQQNANKPDYTTFNGVDDQGNATINLLDKNTGQIVNTGQKVYQTQRQLDPAQVDYYNTKNQQLQDKRIADNEKIFRATPEFENLNEQDKLKAIEQLRLTGKIPEIKYTDGGWFGGEKYFLPSKNNIDLKALADAINKL